MDFATSYRNSAAVSVCDVRFVWLMLIAAVAECTGTERAALQLPNYSSGYYPQHFVLIDPWVSPSSKNTKSTLYKKNNGKSDKSIGGIKEVDAEKYKSGKLMNEEKSTKYKEEKGDDDKYNDKGGDAGEIHTHGGKKKEASYKKGDKQKKFKTKKVCRVFEIIITKMKNIKLTNSGTIMKHMVHLRSLGKRETKSCWAIRKTRKIKPKKEANQTKKTVTKVKQNISLEKKEKPNIKRKSIVTLTIIMSLNIIKKKNLKNIIRKIHKTC